jgi:O-succinylbenzoic acid--CoA ligase
MSKAADALLGAFASFAAEPALVDRNRTRTFRDLWDNSDRVAGALERKGVRPGNRVAILLPESAEYVIVLLACVRMGVTACPLSSRLPRDGVRAALEILGVKALLAEEGTGDWSASATLLREVWASTDGGGASSGGRGAFDGPGLTDSARTAVFTSGSSGAPRAALLTLANHCANAAASNRNIPVQPGDRWLLSLPSYHVAGQAVVFRCLLGGAAIAVPDPGERVGEAMHRYGVTHVSLVPTQLYRLLREDAAVLRGLKAILLGGGPAPDALIREAIAQGLPLLRTYGLTEMASQVTTSRLEDGAQALFTSGKPLVPDTVRIAEDGEIQVRGDSLFEGYVEGGAVRRTLTADGWFPTRDLGCFDEGGNLVVTGREDNQFISGGENIQPEEIEAALGGIEGVVQALVVPVSDEEFGQRPVAFVDMGGAIAPEKLREQLARSLPGFKIPQTFLPWPEECKGRGLKPSRAAFAERLKGRPQ